MTDRKHDAVPILNNLIRSLRDAEIGFDEASRDVRDEQYRKMFAGYARRMAEFESALTEQVVKLGGKPAHDATVTGEVHRIWMHVRAILNLHNTQPVLLESEGVESSLLDHYEKAVQDLPEDQKANTEKQFVELIEIRNHLLELSNKGEDFHPEGKKLFP